MFRIGDLIVDKRAELKDNFPDCGVGMITEIKKVDGCLKYIVDFTLLKMPCRLFENELKTGIGIGDFEYYPVRKVERTH